MRKKLVALLLAILICLPTVSFYATDISKLEDNKESLEEKNDDLKEEEKENEKDIKEKEKELQVLNDKLAELNEKIIVSQEKLREIQGNIDELQIKIDDLTQSVEDKTILLQQRIRAIYMAGDTSSLEIILGAKDFTDLMDKFQLIKSISEHDTKLINELSKSMKDLEEDQDELEVVLEKQKEAQEILDSEQANYEQLVTENKELLKELYDKDNIITDKMHKNNKELEKLEKDIKKYYKELKEKEEAEAEAEKNNSGSSGSSSSSGAGTVYPDVPTSDNYMWPVPGFTYITSTFYEDRGWKIHGALDIAGANMMGTPVYSADSGTVTFAFSGCTHNWPKDMSYSCGCGGGFGNYLMIDHGEGYSTLYAHLTSLVVSTGQTVKKGEVIGYVGTTGHSTGPHLHFETRYFGEKYDPMREYD